LGRLAAEAKLEQMVTALSASEQRMLKELRDRVGPLDKPPLGVVPMLRWAAEHAPAGPILLPSAGSAFVARPRSPASVCMGTAPRKLRTA
jgi:hypothetical protein